MYGALCSLCWDSIRVPNSRACTEWDGGGGILSYGPSGAASLHSVCLILVSQLQGEAHCLWLCPTEITHFICFVSVFFSLRLHWKRFLFLMQHFARRWLKIYALCPNEIQVFRLLNPKEQKLS